MTGGVNPNLDIKTMTEEILTMDIRMNKAFEQCPHWQEYIGQAFSCLGIAVSFPEEEDIDIDIDLLVGFGAWVENLKELLRRQPADPKPFSDYYRTQIEIEKATIHLALKVMINDLKEDSKKLAPVHKQVLELEEGARALWGKEFPDLNTLHDEAGPLLRRCDLLFQQIPVEKESFFRTYQREIMIALSTSIIGTVFGVILTLLVTG